MCTPRAAILLNFNISDRPLVIQMLVFMEPRIFKTTKKIHLADGQTHPKDGNTSSVSFNISDAKL